ncbi:CrcB family protein [Thermochromatium tepidum]|uniref:Fluoride ion transporter CrcB n=1 Tax=Thermochromatium tepidum ATCC 43061 TaxID=316276 RepID=A0A6I6DVX5_THETI|nr:CrcB family protein [Thermochromatium tepidum]QGU31714.1 hypothetical protein E6P07_01115 [Thermochromatium tepidum ATCC 43061]
MTPVFAVAVFLGAGLGALLRWSMGTALHPIFPTLSLGPSRPIHPDARSLTDLESVCVPGAR